MFTEEINLYNAPLRLGTPLRAPVFAWPAWGISWETSEQFYQLVDLSEKAYQAEWQETSKVNHDEIAQATKKAGLADANQRLNEALANIFIKLISTYNGKLVKILDIGAGTGATTKGIFQRLSKSDRTRTVWALLDPAKHSLEQARINLRKEGMSVNQVTFHAERDLEFLPKYHEYFDFVVSTAAIHHHAYLKPIFSGIARTLKRGGVFIVADWHNCLSTHPAIVLSLLMQLDWPGKDSAISLFEEMYPAARQIPHEAVRVEQQQANSQIIRFWTVYASKRQLPAGNFFVLEGHRPVRYYIKEMCQAGFEIIRMITSSRIPNPQFLIPRSELLAVIAARKPLMSGTDI